MDGRTRARSGNAALYTSTCCRRAMRAALPARTSRPGCRTPRRAGTSRHGVSSSRTIRCRRSTVGSVTTRARASATAPSLDSAVSIHSVERFLGDLALEQGWQFDPPQVRSGRRVLVVGAGPERSVGRLPPRPARPRGRDSRLRRADGWDDAVRHPCLPAAPRRAHGGARPDRGARRADELRAQGRGSGRGTGGGGSTRSSSRSGRTCPSGSTSRPGTPGGSSMRSRSCAASLPVSIP